MTSTSKTERRSRFVSQLVCELPDSIIEAVKQRLHEKEGIPLAYQRLTFPAALQVDSGVKETNSVLVEQGLANGKDWQAILFENKKAIGKLLQPQLTCSEPSLELVVAPENASEVSCVIQRITLEFDSWQPSRILKQGKAGVEQLRVIVDDNFKRSQYSVQVFVKGSTGQQSIRPAFLLPGRDLSAAVELDIQQYQYTQKHKAAQGLPLANLEEVTVQQGSGYQTCVTVFDVTERPAHLKRLAVTFPQVIGSYLHVQPGPSRDIKEQTADKLSIGSRQPEPLPNNEFTGDQVESSGGGASAEPLAAQAALNSDRLLEKQQHNRCHSPDLRPGSVSVTATAVSQDEVFVTAEVQNTRDMCSERHQGLLLGCKPLVAVDPAGAKPFEEVATTAAMVLDDTTSESSSDSSESSAKSVVMHAVNNSARRTAARADQRNGYTQHRNGNHMDAATLHHFSALFPGEKGKLAAFLANGETAVTQLAAVSEAMQTAPHPNGMVFVGRKLQQDVPLNGKNGYTGSNGYHQPVRSLSASDEDSSDATFHSTEPIDVSLEGSVVGSEHSLTSQDSLPACDASAGSLGDSEHSVSLSSPRESVKSTESEPLFPRSENGLDVSEALHRRAGSEDYTLLGHEQLTSLKPALATSSKLPDAQDGPGFGEGYRIPRPPPGRSPTHQGPQPLNPLRPSRFGSGGNLRSYERQGMPSSSKATNRQQWQQNGYHSDRGYDRSGSGKRNSYRGEYVNGYRDEMQAGAQYSSFPVAEYRVKGSQGERQRFSDLERFLLQVAPTLVRSDPMDAAEQPVLEAVWRSYEESSLYGAGVPTLGGPRGPSQAYYVPYLSAVQLFGKADPEQPGSKPKLLFQFYERDPPHNRTPLLFKVDELSADEEGGAALKDTPLNALHPASWYAVAWYPIYRIPDAPLGARFLTYHSFTLQTLSDAKGTTTPCLRLIGLKWNNLKGERWLEALGSNATAATDPQRPMLTGSPADLQRAADLLGACSAEQYAWRAVLEELQRTAEGLSRGEALPTVAKPPANRNQMPHLDYAFFSSREY